MSKIVLFVGPVPPPVHGQSVSFLESYKGYPGEKILVNHNVTGGFFVRLFVAAVSILKVFYCISFKKVGVMYFTCNRSFSGSLFDVVIVNFAYFSKVKIVNHLYGGDFKKLYDSQKGLYKRVLRNAYQKVPVSIVLHEAMKKEFSESFPNMNVEVVHNFYDVKLDEIVSHEKHSGIQFVYLSNLIKTKGILELLDAFGELSKKHPHIKLRFVGSYFSDEEMSGSELKKQVEKRLSEFQKNRRDVRYLGALVLGEEKKKLLIESDVFVLPTYYRSEAFPISIIDAMRAGNAIISTNYNYIPDYVRSDQGVLVEPRSVGELRKAMEYFIENPGKLESMRTSNMEYVKQTYSLKTYNARVNAILKSRLQ